MAAIITNAQSEVNAANVDVDIIVQHLRAVELKNILNQLNLNINGKLSTLRERVQGQLSINRTPQLISSIQEQYIHYLNHKKSLKESLAKRKQQSLEEKQSAKRAKLATPVVISGEDISIESSGSSKSTRSYSEVARLPLSPIAGNTRLTKGKMSHQMPYYTSQRIQQQKQLQQQQQAAVLASMNQQAQNHANMYQTGGGANLSHYYMRPPTNPAALGPKLPERHPPVKFKVLPFFDTKHDLIPVSSLQPTNQSNRNQEVSFQFKLTNQQAAELGENREVIPGIKNDWHYQVQLRLASLNTSVEQDDHYPPNLSIKVNQRAVQLPNPIPSRVQNKEPIRPSRPLNISPLCKICPFVMNVITVNWTYEFNNNEFYVLKVEIVKKLTSADLLERLKKKGIKPVEYTTKIIREKLSETDCEIATDTLQVNLACPLSRTRMTIPCRASTCTHLQCFDANTYLQMNEKKQTWVCPVCNQACQYGNLFIDGYFLTVLESYKDGSEIILCKDGTWTGYVPPKDEHKAAKSTSADLADLSIVCLDDDDPPAPTNSVIKSGAELKPSGISIPIPAAAAQPPPPPPEIEEICLD